MKNIETVSRIFSKFGKTFAIGAVALLMFGLLISFAYAAITSLTLTAPNGGEEWRGTQNITWTQTGGISGDTVSLLLSTDSGGNYNEVVATGVEVTDLSYSWDTNNTAAGPLADGSTYRVKVTDGVTGLDFSSSDFMVDNTAPITTATPSFPPAGTGWYNIATGVPTIALSCDDSATGGSGCSDTFYKWDSGSYANYTGPLTPAEGEHTLSYYSEDEAIDALGAHNVETVLTLDTKVDTSAPTASVSYSKDPVKAGDSLIITATFNEDMADSPVVNIEISDANTLSATAMTKVSETEYTYTHTVGAGDGTATVAFSIGTDPAGNPITVAPTGGATFTVDNTAPILAEVTPVPTPDNDSTPDYTFSTDEDGDIAYPGTCSSASTLATVGSNTITLDALSDGSYSGCSLTVTDVAGNTSATLTATAFLIDTVDPVVDAGDDKELKTIIAVQDATVTDDSSGVDITSYAWTETSGPGSITFGTPSAEDTSITAGSEGTYVIRLTTFDNAGNSSFDEMTYVYDTTAPVLTEVTPVTDPTNDTTPSWEFNVDNVGWLPGHTGGTIDYGGSCGIGNLATAVDGNNTTTFGALADGTYADCDIDIIDAAGNTSALLAPTSFEVDTIAATVSTITTEDTDPNGKVDKVTIVFDDEVDDSTFVPGDFVIDGTAATAVGIGGTPDDDTVILTFGTEIDGTEAKTLVYSSSATDLAGNAIAPFSTLATDEAKPMLLSAKTTLVTSIDATFSEDLDGTTVNGTGNEFTVAGYAVSSASESAPGVITLTVATMPTDATPTVTYAEVGSLDDLSGNTAVTPTTVTAVDEVAPILTSVSIASDNAKDTELAKVGDTVTLSFTASEDTATPVVTIDGMTADTISGGPSVWTAVYTFVGGEAEGTIPFTIDFEDLVVPANVGTTVTAVTSGSDVFFDEKDPIVDAGIDREVNAPVTPQGASTSDPAPASGVDTYLWSQESGPSGGIVTFSNPSGTGTGVDTDLAADTDGTYVLKLTVEDEAGNSASDTLTFIWDTTSPVVITSSPADGDTDVLKTADTATVTFDELIKLTNAGKVLLVDNSTGDSFKGTVAVDGGDGTSAILNIDYSTLDYGTKYRINVVPSPQESNSLSAVTDIAGNKLVTSFTSYFTTELDTTPPVVNSFSASAITTTGATLNVTTDESSTCSFATTDSSYASMSAFDTTGGTTHTHVLSGLSSGIGHDYFVRCADTSSEVNKMTTSAHVSFTTLLADTTPPTLTLLGQNPLGLTVGDAYVEYGATASDNEDGDITGSIAIDSSAVNMAVAGTYEVTYNVSDAEGNVAVEEIRTVIVEEGDDVTSPDVPAITTVDTTIDADTYTVAGTVADDGGTRIVGLYNGSTLVSTVSVPSGDTVWSILAPLTQDSTNVFKAEATDEVGNTSAFSTTVTITEATTVGDTTDPAVPVITTLDDGVDADTYTLSGTAGADLPSDGSRTITIYRNSVTTVVGSVVLPVGETVWSLVVPLLQDETNTFTSYSTDEAGNTSAVSNSRVITEASSADTTPPVIVLLGVNSQTFTVGDTYTELGATASDNEDGDITGSIAIDSSAVNMAVAGTYTVTYNVTDVAGNSAIEATREIIVNAVFDDTATLVVTGIDAVKTYATADDSYVNGWSWIYHVTVPTDETQFKMKFSDFISGANSILAADNIRFYTVQASANADDANAITITVANTYSSEITLDSDLEAGTAGRQIEVIVEMKVPVGSAGGSYSGSYGVNSETI